MIVIVNISAGFYNLIEGAGCQECECNPAGSAELGCEQTSGECNCKENVIGTRCDSCKANSFSIRFVHIAVIF